MNEHVPITPAHHLRFQDKFVRMLENFGPYRHRRSRWRPERIVTLQSVLDHLLQQAAVYKDMPEDEKAEYLEHRFSDPEELATSLLFFAVHGHFSDEDKFGRPIKK